MSKARISFEFVDDGYYCPSIHALCAHCGVMTKTGYTCDSLAETAARLLGWAPSKKGFACPECLRKQKEEHYE